MPRGITLRASPSRWQNPALTMTPAENMLSSTKVRERPEPPARRSRRERSTGA